MKLKRSIHLTLILIVLTIPHSVYSETAKTNGFFDLQNGDINITSDSYELDMKNSIASFKGDVSVTGNDMNMSCQKLELYFKNSLKDTSIENSKYSVEKIIATDSVVINRSGGGSATAEMAIYYYESQKIVLTGNPYFKDGDRFEAGGNSIILYLKENRYVVEGTKDDKARLFKSGNDER